MNKISGKKIVIKKYGNRRLYDVTNSAYINQDEVALLVQAGHDVQVVDAATGEDLTRLVLTQIIVQHAKESDSAFPLDVLRQMVVACGKVTQGTTVQYMKAALDMYQNAFRAMAPPTNPFEFLQNSPLIPQTPRSSQPGEGPKQAGKNDESERDTAEIGELKRRIEELESLVSVPRKGTAGHKRKNKRRSPRTK
jgi:polyhydroxyalkanoate synthesis repressor PhaR